MRAFLRKRRSKSSGNPYPFRVFLMISFSRIGQALGKGQVSSICDIRYSFSSRYEISGMRDDMRDALSFPTLVLGYIALYLCLFRPPG